MKTLFQMSFYKDKELSIFWIRYLIIPYLKYKFLGYKITSRVIKPLDRDEYILIVESKEP